MRAMDVMTPYVITIDSDASVQALARLLSERGISGVPVVDSDGQLVGIVRAPRRGPSAGSTTAAPGGSRCNSVG